MERQVTYQVLCFESINRLLSKDCLCTRQRGMTSAATLRLLLYRKPRLCHLSTRSLVTHRFNTFDAIPLPRPAPGLARPSQAPPGRRPHPEALPLKGPTRSIPCCVRPPPLAKRASTPRLG